MLEIKKVEKKKEIKSFHFIGGVVQSQGAKLRATFSSPKTKSPFRNQTQ
jgi:hypothetical protein